MNLETAKMKHGLNELAFHKSTKSGRHVSFNRTVNGMVIFITKEDFDPSKPAFAYTADEITEHPTKEGVMLPAVGYWISNKKGGEAAFVL